MKKINIAQEINCSLVSKLNKLVFLKEKYSKRIEEERLKQSQFSQSTQENNSMIHKLETASERKKIASEECSSVDDSLQLKNCRLNEDINSMLNMLGLDIDVCEYENKRDIIKLMLKGSDIYIKLLFDVQTDDFDSKSAIFDKFVPIFKCLFFHFSNRNTSVV